MYNRQASSHPQNLRERRAEVIRDRDYRDYANAVDRTLTVTFGRALSPHDREELCQEAFANVAAARANGREIRNEKALLITAALNAARSRLRSADHCTRRPFDPLDSPQAHTPSPSVPVDTAVIEAEENRRVSRLIEQLDDPRSRAVLKLRLELGLDWQEIAAYLGLRRRQTYKLLNDAGRALWELIVKDESGERSAELRALLVACEMGTATAEQRRKAAAMVDDPHVRALLAEIRGLGRRAAATLPLPPVAGAAEPGAVTEIALHIKQSITDAAQGLKHQAVGLIGRAPAQETATQLAAAGGARGTGTVAVALVACLGVGGGAAVGVKECIDQGVPTTLVNAIVGSEQSPAASDDERAEGEAPSALDVSPIPLPAAPPAEQTPATDEGSEVPRREAAPSEPTPAPATGGDSLSGLSGDPTPTPAPAPAPTPTTTDNGRPSSTGTDFGGL